MPNSYYNAAAAALQDPRVRAFLWNIRTCEGTTGDRGYFTGFGYHYFSSCADHPGAHDAAGHTASGAYQFLKTSWNTYRNKLQLPDFCERSQDLAATAYLIDLGAVARLQTNDFAGAVRAVRAVWPSVTGGGQNNQRGPCASLAQMQATYSAALGAGSQGPGAGATVLPDPPFSSPAPNLPAPVAAFDDTTLTIIIAGALLAGFVLWWNG